MNKRLACALYLGFLMTPAIAQTGAAADPASAAQAEPPAPPAQVLVSGRRPGPGLWKVSKGEHVMWVFGTYSPLPQNLEWDDGRVARLIAQSQEVLDRPSSGVSIGWVSGFKLLAALPSVIGVKKNPDGAQLREVVPAEAYARWTVLKQKYIGEDDGVERYRPLFAAEQLMDAGLKKHGLSKGGEISHQIGELAKKQGVKFTPTGFSVALDDPNRLLKEFTRSQMEDVACFTKTLENLEGDIDAMRVRANAWAKGNIAEINNLGYADREDACNDAVLNGPLARSSPALQNMRERRLASWLKAAENALADNASTVAMLSMSEILGPKSYLAALQARGYTVESPK